MADTYNVVLNADNSATVQVKFDITGSGLQPNDGDNESLFELPSQDGGWTVDSAIAAVTDSANTKKLDWISALYAAENPS